MSEPQDPASQPPSGYPPVPGYEPAPNPLGSQPGYGPPPGWDPGTGSAPPPAAGWGAPTGQPAWGPPQAQWGGSQQTSTKAVVALVLAISAYLPIVPFIGAVVAVFLAPSARREIEASGGRLTGLGLCRAAFWLSVVHLAFVAVLFMGFVLLVAVGGFGFS